MQISTIAEFTLYDRLKYPNVDGVVAIPHNKGCGCQDGSTIDVMLRTLSNYADHPNVGGVILIDLGCEKTNLAQVEKYLLKREKSFDKPVAKIGIQEVGGTQAAIQRGLKEVEQMLPVVNEVSREEFSGQRTRVGCEVWRLRRLFGDFGQSLARARRGFARSFGRNSFDNRSAGVLWRRTFAGLSCEGRGNRTRNLSHG